MQILTKIYRSYKNKQGEEYKTKDGKVYERVSIQTQEYGDKWLSGFGGSFNKDWKVGDKVDIEIVQNGEFLNFSKVDDKVLIVRRLEKLEKDFEVLRKFLTSAPTKTEPAEPEDYPGPAEEVPF